MNFERKVIETLTDENGHEIKMGDNVVYTIKNKPQSIVAKYLGKDNGYMLFEPKGSQVSYTVQPKTIATMFKANTRDLFQLDKGEN